MSEPAAHRRPFQTRELSLRVASALVMLAATLALTWAGPKPFAGLVACVAMVLMWEWGRLMRRTGIDRLAVVGAAGVLVALVLVVAGAPTAGLGAVMATVLAVFVIERHRDGLLEAAGVLYVGLPAAALVWLRSSSDHGLEAVLLLFLIVWATDIGAFFAGRIIGGPRLWPSISPNKTWAGLIGGVATAVTVAGLFAGWIGSVALVRVLGLAAVLASISQLGDLLESALKRARGVKDTSDLIPGHGGFMDRVDGLIFAVVAAALYALMADRSAPGTALLGLP